MSVQKVMDITGHSEHGFDKDHAVSLKEAMDRFDDLTSKGYRAAKLMPSGDHQIIKAFDPEAEQTLFVPPMQGG